jgi:hypothetical protein
MKLTLIITLLFTYIYADSLDDWGDWNKPTINILDKGIYNNTYNYIQDINKKKQEIQDIIDEINNYNKQELFSNNS